MIDLPEISRARRVIPYAIFWAVLLLGLALAWALHLSSVAQRQSRIGGDLDEIARAISIQMGQNVSMLRAAKALFEVDTDRITPERFARFVSKVDLPHAYPGMRGLGFAALIQKGQEAELARRYGLRQPVHPETDQSLRAPVTMLEPSDERNLAALGYDMYSEPARRAAMIHAEQTDRPVATRPVTLVQEITADVQTGFLVYLPTRDADGRAVGFAYAPFRIGDFLSGAGVQPLLSKYLVRVEDVTEGEPRLLYQTAEGEGARGEGDEQLVDLAERRWRVAIFETTVSSRGDLARALGVAALALVLALLVAHSYRDQQRAQAVESALAQARLKALADREVLLQEMNHRIKNAIARIGAIARTSARGAASLDDFQRSFAGRLSAMAAAQDLAVSGADLGASLSDILMAELGQIFQHGDARLTMQGAPVHLDGRHAQALALVAHELATNASKYGAAHDPSGGLSVTWSRVANGPLVIDWVERCAVVEPEAGRKGFGSRLMQMMVEGELKGRIERELRPDGLRLRIELPLTSGAVAA